VDLANHDGAGLKQKPSGAMSNLFAKLFLALLTLSVCASVSCAQGASANPSDACLAFKRGLSLGAPLTGIRAKLQSGKALTVVALGSSSTTGFGTGSGGAFPDVMKRELMRLRPSARIELINSGRIMDNIPGNVGRLESDVLNHKPDLVVWQLGSNDAVWRGIAGNVKEMITNAVKRLKAANTDIVLVDLQYAPLVLASDRHVRMEKIIAEVAREQNVGLFPRFVLMKRAVDGGVKGLVLWDGLHNSAEGNKCIGVALAQMIDAAAR
jgi:lysophospholipase L1-like esterase